MYLVKISILLMVSVLFGSAPAISCPYKARESTLVSQHNALIARAKAMGTCTPAKLEIIIQILNVRQNLVEVDRQASADSTCIVGSASRNVEAIQEAIVLCKRVIAESNRPEPRQPTSQAARPVIPTLTPPTPVQTKPAPTTGSQRTACNNGASTITGTGSDSVSSEDRRHCNQASFHLQTARSARRDSSVNPKIVEDTYKRVIESLRWAGDFKAAQEVAKERDTPISLTKENPALAKTQAVGMYRVAETLVNNASAERNRIEKVSIFQHAASRFDDAAQFFRDANDKEAEQMALRKKAEAMEAAKKAAQVVRPVNPGDKSEQCRGLNTYIAKLKERGDSYSASLIPGLEEKKKLLGPSCK